MSPRLTPRGRGFEALAGSEHLELFETNFEVQGLGFGAVGDEKTSNEYRSWSQQARNVMGWKHQLNRARNGSHRTRRDDMNDGMKGLCPIWSPKGRELAIYRPVAFLLIFCGWFS